ncbi:MAG: hypothetical protein ABSF64_35980 [Bryobacteraceae bacterium]
MTFLAVGAALILLAALVNFVWRKFQDSRTESWPTAQGHFALGRSYTGTPGTTGSRIVRMEIAYYYSVEGNYYGGWHRCAAGTEQAADDLIRRLNGKAIDVRYDPKKLANSWLPQSAIDALLR